MQVARVAVLRTIYSQPQLLGILPDLKPLVSLPMLTIDELFV